MTEWLLYLALTAVPVTSPEVQVFTDPVLACRYLKRNHDARLYGLRPVETYCFTSIVANKTESCPVSWKADPVRCERWHPERPKKTWRIVED